PPRSTLIPNTTLFRSLFVAWYADSPAIVLYDQHHRSLKDTGKIQGFIEITLRAGPIATDANSHHRVTGDFSSHGHPNGMQHLRRSEEHTSDLQSRGQL